VEGTARWTIEQGFELGRPSIIELAADVEDGAAQRIRVGGGAVFMGAGTLRAPGE
jgi:trans-2,3-dihydro-3-hydroxyanthranilate isomerase